MPLAHPLLSVTIVHKNQKSRILIVEDDPDIAETISAALTMDDYEHQIAGNGREALNLLEKTASEKSLPHLILLDITMPIMDGSEFLFHQKANPRFSKIPVILMSAANDSIRQGILSQVAAHVRKPMDVWEFLATIKQQLRQQISS